MYGKHGCGKETEGTVFFSHLKISKILRNPFEKKMFSCIMYVDIMRPRQELTPDPAGPLTIFRKCGNIIIDTMKGVAAYVY